MNACKLGKKKREREGIAGDIFSTFFSVGFGARGARTLILALPGIGVICHD